MRTLYNYTMEEVLAEYELHSSKSISQINNPNGCPARGSFFIEDQGSDYILIKSLYDDGNEIGINSVDGTAPATSTAWIQMIKSKLLCFIWGLYFIL